MAAYVVLSKCVWKIQWNTGRRYTEEGQVITAEVVDESTVRFTDHSRMITGTIEGEHVATLNPWLLRDAEAFMELVMHAYDHGKYLSGWPVMTRIEE